nr:hypothetical protein [Kibdelosporangium sp. MJ126-NF4]CTQ90345.1 hypothetical protein [Kibdelosporangium sp. MJ126-NF4]
MLSVFWCVLIGVAVRLASGVVVGFDVNAAGPHRVSPL